MAEQEYKKYSLFTPAVTQNNQLPGKGNDGEKISSPPLDTTTPKTPDETYALQEKFSNVKNLSDNFSSLNDADILNTIRNAMLMSAANPYYRNNFGKNDINGRMNNKTYNATLNMQRLVDRYNNRERIMPGMATAGRYGVAAGNNEIVKNTPIETVDTRQYAQDLEVSAEQREKDLNRADLVASAIPNKYAKSKEAEVLVNQFLIQNEANMNSYMRQLFADTQLRMPTSTMLQEKLLQFGRKVDYDMGVNIYNQAVALSNNHVFMNLWTNLMKGVDSPDQFQILYGKAQKEIINTVNKYGGSLMDRYLLYNLFNYAIDLGNYEQTQNAVMETMKRTFTGGNN